MDRAAAAEAINAVFAARKVPERLPAIVALAADELLIIFDKKLRIAHDRASRAVRTLDIASGCFRMAALRMAAQ